MLRFSCLNLERTQYSVTGQNILKDNRNERKEPIRLAEATGYATKID